MLELIIHLLFIVPTGEEYTSAEQAQTIQDVRDAASFWGYSATIDTKVLTTSVDVYTNPINMWATLSVGLDNEVYVYSVDHSHSGALLFGYGGYAQDYYRLLTVVNGGDQNARIAHELGHILYGLPDWYKIPGKCTAPDIMCDPVVPFRMKFKGCDTLEFIGTPCYRVTLPVVVNPSKNNAR